MVRSLFSGVSGMKAHQTRLDVIGNNISNVNTYGFKSSRATFRDMYYQNIRGAAAGTANRGGLNPSAIGYGSSIASVDLLMTQSAMSPTGNPLDVCITGEGFLQVQDPDGNIYYTKAGMLDIDNNGNLVDTNGNFVLGTSGDPVGKAPGSSKIQFTVPPVDPTVASLSDSINGMTIKMKASNTTKDGNVSFSFTTATDLPIGTPMEAVMDGSNITIRVNANETFNGVSAFQDAVNGAIKEARGGKEHPAGLFTVEMDPDPFATAEGGKLTGAQITQADTGNVRGSATMTDPDSTPAGAVVASMWGGFSVMNVGSGFKGASDIEYKIEHVDATATDPEKFIITATTQDKDGGTLTYTGSVEKDQMPAASGVLLTNGADKSDSITMYVPSYSNVEKAAANPADGTVDWTIVTDKRFTGAATASKPSGNLGLSTKTLKLTGGTAGGAQTAQDLSSINIGADGTIVATHAVHGRIYVGRIDLANFDNPRGLEQSGNSYYAQSENSGKASLVIPGENGTGALKNSALEMSNVDLSTEFADMITTQRGFQANSRLITVSDTMLEELINLKR